MYVQPDPENHVLDFGKYQGQKLKDIAATPSGLSYLKVMERCSYGYSLRCIRAFLKALKDPSGARPPPSSPQSQDIR